MARAIPNAWILAASMLGDICSKGRLRFKRQILLRCDNSRYGLKEQGAIDRSITPHKTPDSGGLLGFLLRRLALSLFGFRRWANQTP
jgi:hypothetical protein